MSETPAKKGPYLLERRLGRGAMGEVWLARHEQTGGVVAVKLVPPALATKRRNVESLETERRAIARLAHPHIVARYELADGHIAMAYIDGVDLTHKLRAPMEPAEAVRITMQIGSALAHAHERGVVHCDVKPSNILLDRHDNAFLADFGIAQLTDERVPGRAVVPIGTPGYMAPEQRGWDGATPAADQYALGRTLLRALAGDELPDDWPSVRAKLPVDLPPDLVACLERATREAPGERFASVAELTAALSAIDLSATGPHVLVADRVRSRRPFGWAEHPIARVAHTPEIAEARYRLRHLEAAHGDIAQASMRFRERSAYEDFGWSVFGHEGRLGRIDSADAFSRADVAVVLAHGWMCTREAWRRIALAICRDNARAIVLVPDVHGFGESRFSAARSRAQTSPGALAQALLSWLEVLGIEGLPRVLVGHSLAATGLMTLEDRALHPHTARVALTPLFPEHNRRAAVMAPLVALLFQAARRFPSLFRRLARSLDAREEWRGLTAEQRAIFARELARADLRALADITRMNASAKTAPVAELARCSVIIGARDPHWQESMLVSAAVEKIGMHRAQVHRFATGGHYPHFEHCERPEETSRNVDDIVRIIDQVVDTAREDATVTTSMPTLHSKELA
ncbi:MAG: protein kinase [Deltaproteobacteria bacterium]|nr:protein kinase [Deltaproteobacteria bacterium]